MDPPNQLPTAEFSSSATDLDATFSAAASSDPDGTLVSWAWDFGDTTTGTGVHATHTFAAAGTYPVTLTVTDNRGGTATVSHDLKVLAANQLPTAAFSSTPNKEKLTFDAAASSDPDGTLQSYAWAFGDGATGDGVSATHTYAGGGTYTVTLTVTDDRGGQSVSSKDVTVVANVKPTAAFSSSSTFLAAAFDGTASTDSDGTVADYAWDFGDGTNSTAASPNHTYATAGSYTVKLTVTDNDGQPIRSPRR